MSRYLPSPIYLHASVAALALAAISSYIALSFLPAAGPAILLLLSGLALLYIYRRPVVEIHPTHLTIGDRRYSWTQIRQLDHSGWVAPLIVRLKMQDNTSMTLVYPGDLESANMLLRELRQHAHLAVIDGVVHRDYWRREDETVLVAPPVRARKADQEKHRYPLVSAGEEEEIEKLYQRLKTVGHLEQPRDDQ